MRKENGRIVEIIKNLEDHPVSWKSGKEGLVQFGSRHPSHGG